MAMRWWLFVPVHASACIVALCPFVAALASARSSATVAGRRRCVKVFQDGDLAAGINSSQRSSHSVLSTQESGKPADAVRQVKWFSNRFCFSADQVFGSAVCGWEDERLNEG